MTNNPMPKLRIAIAVHGRFHAFDLARELLRRGHDVTLLTNYPRFAVARFGVPPERVRSLVLHGVIGRAFWRVGERYRWLYPEALLHRWFGRWVAAQVRWERWDVVVCWSGIGEEAFRALEGTGTLRICQRGSAHIRTQARLLEEEERRTGVPQDRPSPWIIAREEREYALADVIWVPSSFVKQTFLEQGVPEERLVVTLLGVDTRVFRPSVEVIESRCQRLLAGEPLRVLYVGTFSYRKGMWDMAQVVGTLAPEGFQFRFVGPVAAECQPLVAKLSKVATFIPKQPQQELPRFYAWGDVFVLPTIEDGYQMILAQTAASGLPFLTTSHGAGPDLVRDGITGWVLPIRAPDVFIRRLRWCHNHRKELATMVRRIYNDFRPRDWADVAADFEHIISERKRIGRVR